MPVADLVITVCMAALFAAALVASTQWSIKAALFPRFVTGLGLALALMHLAALGVRLLPGADRAPLEADAADSGAAPADPPAQATADDDVAAEADVEYVFAHASRGAWLRSLGWVAAFFLSLYVLGLFVTAPLFAFTYLRLSAQRSWLFCAVYAAVTWALLYVAFAYALEISVPTGLLW